jgi:hypothetical protein
VTLGGDLTTNTATLTSGQFQVGANQTFTLNGTVTFGGGSLKADNSNATVNYASIVAGQKVIPGSYWNLTLSGGVGKDLSIGTPTYTIMGNFATDFATHTTAGSTLDFAGATQSISTDFNYVNFVSSGAGTKSLTGTSTTLDISGDFDNGGLTNGTGNASVLDMGSRSFSALGGVKDNSGATIQFGGANNGKVFATGTVEYNGGTQTIKGDAVLSYAKLTLSGGAVTKTVAEGAANTVATTGDLDVSASLQLDVDATVTGAGILNVGGILTNLGTVNVKANGANLATLTAATFNNGDAAHTTVQLNVDGTLSVSGNLDNWGFVTNNGTITVGP